MQAKNAREIGKITKSPVGRNQRAIVDIFAGANSIYEPYSFDIALLRYDRNPFSPRRAYRVVTHIERIAYIENPKGIYIDF